MFLFFVPFGEWNQSTLKQMPDANALAFLFSGQYMGCVEVLQSMRALDFSTRTQVTR